MENQGSFIYSSILASIRYKFVLAEIVEVAVIRVVNVVIHLEIGHILNITL